MLTILSSQVIFGFCRGSSPNRRAFTGRGLCSSLRPLLLHLTFGNTLGMSYPQLPGSFSSSRLVRRLARLGLGRKPAGPLRLASRVGGWLELRDAISLSAALNGRQAAVPGGRADGGSDRCLTGAATLAADGHADARLDFERLRETFGAAIVAGTLARPGKPRIRLPEVNPAAGEVAGFLPYHRYYLAMQGEMEGAVRLLRVRTRNALAATTPAGAALAALDAALEAALAERERTLLAEVPQLLADRFEALQQAGGHGFVHELRELLLAELELRLLPVVGLIEAQEQQCATTSRKAQA